MIVRYRDRVTDALAFDRSFTANHRAFVASSPMQAFESPRTAASSPVQALESPRALPCEHPCLRELPRARLFIRKMCVSTGRFFSFLFNRARI